MVRNMVYVLGHVSEPCSKKTLQVPGKPSHLRSSGPETSCLYPICEQINDWCCLQPLGFKVVCYTISEWNSRIDSCLLSSKSYLEVVGQYQKKIYGETFKMVEE